MAKPYRSTPIFDERSLPEGLKGVHRTKAGVWAVIRVIEGELRLTLIDRKEELILSPDSPAIVGPEQPHTVAPMGPMRMQVDFYNEPPTTD